jgi:hypothetical protein
MTDAADPGPKSLELPMAMWVRGGTTSSQHDRSVAEARADADRRRAVEDARQRLVLNNPNEGRIRSLDLTDSHQHPIVVLRVTRPEDLVCEMTCELIWRPTSPPFQGRDHQWLLQLVCPACVYRHGRRVGESQLSIQEINRAFEIDRRRMGELYVTPDGEAFTLAGTVHTKDWIHCDHLGCGFHFRITDSEIISR